MQGPVLIPCSVPTFPRPIKEAGAGCGMQAAFSVHMDFPTAPDQLGAGIWGSAEQMQQKPGLPWWGSSPSQYYYEQEKQTWKGKIGRIAFFLS